MQHAQHDRGRHQPTKQHRQPPRGPSSAQTGTHRPADFGGCQRKQAQTSERVNDSHPAGPTGAHAPRQQPGGRCNDHGNKQQHVHPPRRQSPVRPEQSLRGPIEAATDSLRAHLLDSQPSEPSELVSSARGGRAATKATMTTSPRIVADINDSDAVIVLFE